MKIFIQTAYLLTSCTLAAVIVAFVAFEIERLYRTWRNKRNLAKRNDDEPLNI